MSTLDTRQSTSCASTTSSRRTSCRDHDTGFPESFASRTTSWRHPDANTSAGASISADDVDAGRTFHRSAKSFLKNRHKRAISYGKIDTNPTPKSTNPTLQSIDSAIDVTADEKLAHEGRPSSKDTDSLGRTESGHGGDSPSSRFEPPLPEMNQPESPPRKTMFGKLRRKA